MPTDQNPNLTASQMNLRLHVSAALENYTLPITSVWQSNVLLFVE